MSEHTPEPWIAKTDCPGECCWMIYRDGEDDSVFDAINSPEMREADARRIVACVNACAGIDTSELELSKTTGLNNMAAVHSSFPERLYAIEQQRDELLAALKSLCGLAVHRGGHLDEYKAAVQDARAAITKAETAQ